ncbi:translational GTPase TypA [Armatimonas sp.]|uniref:translational GTPase TypA n=1 Tax=Armatimonas sp. TaxID=1872638 RepID=UPI00286B06FC|nr:translational GTPase TypA [Armatimonas sp.]
MSGFITMLRNIAIIAHVDHGKTTLLDGMLKQGGVFRENQEVAERVMDRMDQERERGITIISKHTALTYKGNKINVVDTPGHADFGGEVERVLLVVDGVLLLVDAVDGPMPQTRFVLEKALSAGLKAIVVINKMDRQEARPDWVVNETFDLFHELGATDDQLDFPIVYATALDGRSSLNEDYADAVDLQPLFDTILSAIPEPKVLADKDAPTQAMISTIDGDPYLGRLGIGKLFAGTLRPNQPVTVFRRDGSRYNSRLQSVFVYEGMKRVPVEEAYAGDIIAVTGLPEVTIGETIATGDNPQQIPPPTVDDPTLQMTFAVNTSPLAGREGQYSTSRKLRERLFKELETNVSLKVEESETPDSFIVYGRGELHLSVLIETMRREGYELQVSMPEVITRTGEKGEKLEPFERVFISLQDEYAGSIVQALGERRGVLMNMQQSDRGDTRLEIIIPTRGLLGFRSRFLTLTRGTGIMSALLEGYLPWAGPLPHRSQGSLIANESGMTTNFGLANAEERGELFIGPGLEVYEGMIVGRHQRDGDLVMSVTKTKQLTNMRASTSDVSVRLTPPSEMGLDRAMEYIGPDELMEVTPKNIRMRKRELNFKMRKRSEKSE